MNREVNFGVQLWPESFDYEEMIDAAKTVEDLGYDSLWLYDHFYPMSKATSWDIFESWTLLSALAEKLNQIRRGVLVTCNSYRHPTVLAKIASTVDVISEGKLEFGIGAGWHEEEHRAYGIPFPDAVERIERLDESVELIKKIWTEKEATFRGDYYKSLNLRAEPKPVQKPHPPVWVGGNGNMTLKVAAKHADYSNFDSRSVEETKERLEVLRKHCSDIGRDFEEIEKSMVSQVVVSEDDEQARKLALEFKKETTIEILKDMPEEKYFERVISGSPETCAEKIREYMDLGITYFIFSFAFDEDLGPERIFMNEVIPELG